MVSISPELESAIAADIRKPRVRLDFTWTDPYVGSGNTVTSTSENNACGVDAAVKEDYLEQICDTRTVPTHKYIVNDGTWANDGTFYWAPATIEEVANNQIGWYSSEVSDSSGSFSTPPTATVDFGEDRAIQFIRVVGDSILGQYPVDFSVYIYDSSMVLIDSETVLGNDQVEYICDFTSSSGINDARYIKLEIDTWSESGTVSKILEFFGVITDTFYTDDVSSLNILEEVEFDDTTTPISNASINELHLDMQNIEITRSDGTVVADPFFPDNSASYLNNSITPNVRIDAYFYFEPYSTEFIKMGTFWSTQWDVSETNFAASIVARDRLEILRNNKFRLNEVLEAKTFTEIAEAVLNHAKVNIPLNDLTWSISSDFDNDIVPYTWFGEMTYFEALKKIAMSRMGRLYTNRNDQIVLETYTADQISGSPNITISKDDYFECDRPINHSGIKNYIEVPYCSLGPESEAGDVYTTDAINVGAGSDPVVVNVEWGDDALVNLDFDWSIQDEDGVTMSRVSKTLYGWGAQFVAIKTSGIAGTFKINVTGRKLILESVGIKTALDESGKLKKYGRNELILPQNFLLQDPGMAQEIANALLETFKDPRKDISVEIQGNPALEIGDIASIEVYSKDSTYDEFRIMRQEFEYDGGLRCKITGRKTINYT